MKVQSWFSATHTDCIKLLVFGCTLIISLKSLVRLVAASAAVENPFAPSEAVTKRLVNSVMLQVKCMNSTKTFGVLILLNSQMLVMALAILKLLIRMDSLPPSFSVYIRELGQRLLQV